MLSTNVVFAETYPDPLLTLPVTPENIAKAKEIDAYTLGVSAYLWGYPLVRMERVMRETRKGRSLAPAIVLRLTR